MVLYIDVYFFINFTVDILSIYFALRIIHTEPQIHRVIIGSVIGSILALVAVLLNLNSLGFVLLLFLCVVLLSVISAKNISFVRRVRFGATFLIIETLIGGIVSFFYSYLNTYIYPYFFGNVEQAENKSLLVLSIIILIGYGILRIAISFFGGFIKERSVKLSAELLGIRFSQDALVDSGNYLKDPIDGTPVTLVKAGALNKRLEGKTFSEILELIEPRFKTKIRLIPTNSIGGKRLLVGVLSDIKVKSKFKKKDLVLKTVIAIDEEEGSYAGYSAIIPASFLD